MMQKPVSSQIPRGVGCPPPPGMDPRKGKGKLMCIKVRMLDDTVGVFHLGHKAPGQALFDEVCRHLNLLESDYFGLEFIDSYGNRCWLDKEKSILRQIMAAQSDARFFFIVKFYTPNPAELEEEYTRYLFALQLRRDLARGELLCNENTAALLVSFIVQSECGDFSPLDYPDHTYLSATQFVPNQSAAFQLKVMEQHQKLVGMSPAEADFNLLETARRCDFYGIRLHNGRDLEGIEVALSVAHMGIKVFHHLNCVTTFSWAKVRKLSFKRKRLMIKIHPDSNQQYKETIEFLFENRDDCKNFWKKCVEHHSFFRCPESLESKSNEHRRLFHRGSHFHYQGRTQKQLIDYVREHRKRREPFERPLRRSGAPSTANSTLLNHHPAMGVQASDPHAQQRALFVSDRMAGEYSLEGMASRGRHVNFPSICMAQQNGGGNGSGGMANGGGTGKKPRPKSALLDNVASTASHSQQRRTQPGSHAGHDPMQQSCHGAILPTMPMGNGSSQQQRLEQMQLYQQQQLIFHQQMDPMSMSLPNVLAPSALQTDGCCFYAAPSQPLKSMSGENFHVLEQRRREREADNQSEGSYRIGCDPNGPGGGGTLGSSQSDIGSTATAPAGSVDPRVYQTTFTTKRVGNVIVKRVTANSQSAGTAPTEPGQPRTSSTSSASARPAFRRQQQPVSPSSSMPGPPPPIASARSIEPATIPALDGLRSGCSSACCSDYSLASSSAPTSARSAAAGMLSAGAIGRLRFAPNGGGGMAGRLRHEIPVAIDGPPGKPGASSTSATPSPIIRPVLLPSPPGRRQSASSASTSANSTPTQATVVGGSRKPLVLKAPNAADFGGILAGKGTKIVPITRVNEAVGSPKAGDEQGTGTGSPKTLGSPSGPLPGRIIRKQDLVITPNGIELKPATTGTEQMKRTDGEEEEHNGNGPMEAAAEGKPKVPPKPDLQQLNSKIQPPPSLASSSKQKADPDQHQALLDPLESILKDVQAINAALEELPSAAGHSQAGQRVMPTAIAIHSEERPDLKTVHLFHNGGGPGRGESVPYTLTVRDVSGQRQGKETDAGGGGMAGTGRCEHSSRHGKSIEVVQRRRLPSQDSYSSQDHSISPTSPDTGNVMEYMLRNRRSQSSERAVQGQQKGAVGKGLAGRRSAERRLTQPVELGSCGGGAGTERAGDGPQSEPGIDANQQKAKPKEERLEADEKRLLETDF